MKPSAPSGARRLVKRALLVACVALVVTAAWFFPRAGRALVVEQPLESADAIVALAGPRVERWLEAVELYREKVSPRIVVSPGRIDAAEEALRARGIRFPREVDLITDAMVQLGIPRNDIETFPGSVDNTAAEASAARTMAARFGWRRILVVTSKYHTRRTLYAFERTFRGTGIEVRIRATRFDAAQPEAWWQHRADLRMVISEWQKLLAYRLGLGE